MKQTFVKSFILLLCACLLLAGCGPLFPGGAWDELPANAVAVALTGGGAQTQAASVRSENGSVVITGAGNYLLSGTLENGSIIVDAGRNAAVGLVLNGVEVHADTFAAICVKRAKSVRILLPENTENMLSCGEAFLRQYETQADAAVYSAAPLAFGGRGALTLTAPAGHGVSGLRSVSFSGGEIKITAAKTAVRSNVEITVSGGAFALNAGTDGLHAENEANDTAGRITVSGGSLAVTAGDDALHAHTRLQITGGSLAITAAEGLEATRISITGGTVVIDARDDGVNAAHKSKTERPLFEITGGSLAVTASGKEADCIDANGDIRISGGSVSLTGTNAFDYTGFARFTGGKLTVNGERLKEIP